MAEVKKAMGIEQPLLRPHCPLHSGLYEKMGQRIPVLIFDESHKAKDSKTLLSAAVRSLKYDHAFLLSGTPMPNTWQDLAAQLMLLPGGGPIVSPKHYAELFGDYDEKSHSARHPTGLRLVAWRRFVISVMFGRPREVLTLPPIEVHMEHVNMKQEPANIIIIDEFVQGARKQLHRARSSPRERSKHVKRALAMLARARRLGQHELLVDPLGEDSIEKQRFERRRAEYQMLFQEYLSNNDLSPEVQPHELGASQSHQFMEFYLEHREVGVESARKHQVPDGSEGSDDEEYAVPTGDSEDESDDGSEEDADGEEEEDSEEYPRESDNEESEVGSQVVPTEFDQEIMMPELSGQLDLTVAAQNGEFIVEDGDDEDKTHQKALKGIRRYFEEEAEDKGDPDDAGGPFAKRPPIRSDRNLTQKWLDRLAESDDTAIFNSRVSTVVSKIQSIRFERPRDKILVVSLSVMFLDIVKEALRRTSQQEPNMDSIVSEYNGSMNARERSETLRQFNHPNNGSVLVMLMSAHAGGGVGVNVTSASHMILCDVFGDPDTDMQAISRIHRLGQTRPVHLYRLFCPDSRIDTYVNDSRERKERLDSRERRKKKLAAVISKRRILARHDLEEWIPVKIPCREEFHRESAAARNHEAGADDGKQKAESVG